jgi:hypothetical protein
MKLQMQWKLPPMALVQPQAQQAMQRAITGMVQEFTLRAEREVKRRTPVGATGLLRNSIQSEVRGVSTTAIRGVVATALVYGLPVEHGSRPHFAPIGPLKYWARRVLGNERAAYAVRWAIARRGTPARHMFRLAYEALRGPFREASRQLGATLKAMLMGHTR